MLSFKMSQRAGTQAMTCLNDILNSKSQYIHHCDKALKSKDIYALNDEEVALAERK